MGGSPTLTWRWFDSAVEVPVPNPFQLTFSTSTSHPLKDFADLTEITVRDPSGTSGAFMIALGVFTGTWGTASGTAETYQFIQQGTQVIGVEVDNGLTPRPVTQGIASGTSLFFTNFITSEAEGVLELSASWLDNQFPGELTGSFTHRDGTVEPYDLIICGYVDSPASCPPSQTRTRFPAHNQGAQR
jgi:hypothetical protein